MAARLGEVLYWAASAIGAAWVLFWLYFISTFHDPEMWSFFWVVGAGGGLVSWLIGRAAKYVLAGE
jgi:hypothetical protein